MRDITALEIELKADCEEFKVLLEPYSLFIPGQVLVGTTVRRKFKVINRHIYFITEANISCRFL